jgi:hypothetical protein
VLCYEGEIVVHNITQRATLGNGASKYNNGMPKKLHNEIDIQIALPTFNYQILMDHIIEQCYVHLLQA